MRAYSTQIFKVKSKGLDKCTQFTKAMKKVIEYRVKSLQTRNYKHHTNDSKSSEMYIGLCQTAMLEILCEKWQGLEIQVNFYSEAAINNSLEQYVKFV